VYRIITDRSVLEQLDSLPVVALVPYAEAMSVLELAPGNGRPCNADKPDGPMRELVFGAAGQGVITYLVRKQPREVHVLLVQWAG
jgi:hypothetical protein